MQESFDKPVVEMHRRIIAALEQELADRKDAFDLFRDEFDTVKGEYKALESRNAEMLKVLKTVVRISDEENWSPKETMDLIFESKRIIEAENNRTKGDQE